MANRITIVSGKQLSDNPRVVKEGRSLAMNGYDVTILSSNLTQDGTRLNRILEQDLPCKVVNLVDRDSRGSLRYLRFVGGKINCRISRLLFRCLGIATSELLLQGTKRMLQYCIQHPADLYIAHTEAGLWVADHLLRLGKNVAVDIEDWHTRDLRDEDRADYPIRLLQRLESSLVPRARSVTTTSQSLADALQEAYRCIAPVVIHNAFPLSERRRGGPPPFERPQSLKRHCRIGWVSQVIGPDRGLEQLAKATHYLQSPIEIELIGKSRTGMDCILRKLIHPLSKLTIRSPVPHHELLGVMQEFDIGFAGEIAYNSNKDLTISNKILHYFLAGIPVVASNTQGQSEVCNQVPGATRLYSQRDPESLAKAIDSLTENPETLRSAKQMSWIAGSTVFCWDACEPKLIDTVASAIVKRM